MIDLAEALRPPDELLEVPLVALAAVRGRARRRRRRRRRRGAVLVACLALVVGLLAGLLVARRPAPNPLPAGPIPQVASVGAPAMAEGHWSALGGAPLAPLQGRVGAVVAWTGHEVIVWGGLSDNSAPQATDNGVAYDPDTGRWRRLPAAPLGPRTDAASVWTGRELIVWGGSPDAVGATRPYWSDGAAYDPATNRWRRLPAAPLGPRTAASAVWTGREMVVVGGVPWSAVGEAPAHSTERLSSDPGDSNQAAAFDPASDRWVRLPDLPVARGRRLTQVRPVWTDRQLLVWWQWAHITDDTGTSFGFQPGALLATFDTAHDRWTQTGLSTQAGCPESSNPVVDGARVLFPAAAYVPPYSISTPIPSGLRGCHYDPPTASYAAIAHGRLDDTGGPVVWTGQALVRIDVSVTETGPGTSVQPGQADVWDATTDRWTELAPVDLGSRYDVTAAVWTGHQVVLLVSNSAIAGGAVAGFAFTPG